MIYKIKINAKEIKSMSRTILIDADQSFQKLHIYIQKVFGLEACHLYDFKYGEEFFVNIPEDEDEEKNFSLWISLLDNTENEVSEEDEEDIFGDELAKIKTYNAKSTKLSEIFDAMNISDLEYVYDFGDYRDFDIKLLEKIVDNWESGKLPKLIASEWHYLIEDCWGPRWYNELLEMMTKKKYDDDLFESEEDFIDYIKPMQKKVVLDV